MALTALNRKSAALTAFRRKRMALTVSNVKENESEETAALRAFIPKDGSDNGV